MFAQPRLRTPLFRYSFSILMLMLCGNGCSLVRPTKPNLPNNGATTRISATTDRASVDASRRLELMIALETADLARKRGMDDEAISQYLVARSLDPSVRGVAHPLAVLYDRAGKMDAAQREYRTAMNELGDHADLLSDYGYFLYSRGKCDEAEAMLRSALKSQPKHHQATVNLGLVVGASGHYEEAQKLFTEAIGPAAALHNIGMLKLRAGDQAGAFSDLKNASSQDPSLTESRQVIARLENKW